MTSRKPGLPPLCEASLPCSAWPVARKSTSAAAIIFWTRPGNVVPSENLEFASGTSANVHLNLAPGDVFRAIGKGLRCHVEEEFAVGDAGIAIDAEAATIREFDEEKAEARGSRLKILPEGVAGITLGGRNGDAQGLTVAGFEKSPRAEDDRGPAMAV